jgi:two-component system response regulator
MPGCIADEPRDREVEASCRLRKAGVASEVIVARDGAEALHQLFGAEAREAWRKLSDLILLDLKLPKLDGHEVLKRIRADVRTQVVPAVILTTSLEDEDRLEGYRVGANSYVRKPVDLHEFSNTVLQLGLYWLVLNEQPPQSHV